MRQWQSGTFERERVSTLFRAFAPARATDTLEEIDLQELYATGKRLILLDVDNTLVEWKQENFSEPVLNWVAEAKELGFTLCIISNTRRVQRLARIKDFLGVETVRGRFKPSRVMFRLALIKFGKKREEAVMIGDQMMTDILGANRAGIDAIWVRQIAPKEFGPTKINRFIEGLLTSAVYKALVMPENMGEGVLTAQQQREVKFTEQIIRFGIIGITSFAIDYAIIAFLTKSFGHPFGSWLRTSAPGMFGWAKTDANATALFFKSIAALVAMYNSYVWNRAWTFEAKGKSRKSTQLTRFYFISIIGLGLNTLIFNFLFNEIPSHPMLLSNAVAAAIVAVWNFIGQRQFAFKESNP